MPAGFASPRLVTGSNLTQRGNNKQPVFSTDADRQHFLDRGRATLRGTRRPCRRLHPDVCPTISTWSRLANRQDAISHFMMQVNGQYATYRNSTQRTAGRIWRNRFYSCVLDDLRP